MASPDIAQLLRAGTFTGPDGVACSWESLFPQKPAVPPAAVTLYIGSLEDKYRDDRLPKLVDDTLRSYRLKDLASIDDGKKISARHLIYVSVDETEADAASASARKHWVAIDRSSALAVAALFGLTPANRATVGPRVVILDGETYSVINPDASAKLGSETAVFPWL
jgi:hypothetical protein